MNAMAQNFNTGWIILKYYLERTLIVIDFHGHYGSKQEGHGQKGILVIFIFVCLVVQGSIYRTA